MINTKEMIKELKEEIHLLDLKIIKINSIINNLENLDEEDDPINSVQTIKPIIIKVKKKVPWYSKEKEKKVGKEKKKKESAKKKDKRQDNSGRRVKQEYDPCPRCNSENTRSGGFRTTSKGRFQVIICKDCKRKFTEGADEKGRPNPGGWTGDKRKRKHLCEECHKKVWEVWNKGKQLCKKCDELKKNNSKLIGPLDNPRPKGSLKKQLFPEAIQDFIEENYITKTDPELRIMIGEKFGKWYTITQIKDFRKKEGWTKRTRDPLQEKFDPDNLEEIDLKEKSDDDYEICEGLDED